MAKLQDLRKECKSKNIAFTPKNTITQLENKLNGFKMKNDPVTQEQIDAWKDKYSKVHKLTVIVKKDAYGKTTDEAVGYLRNPTRNHKATAMSMFAQNKIMECGEFLKNNCWLGGDERLKDKGEIADTASVSANGIIEFLDGELGEV